MGILMKAYRRWTRIYFLRRHAKNVRKQPVVHSSLPYNPSPRVTAIVQLFNKRENIVPIVTALIEAKLDEIIIMDDGSSDGVLDILPQLLTGKNHFIIRSNDLFEIRTYSRAIDYARGEIVALLQDDDMPPFNGDWVREAVALFDRYPKLAVLGGRDGLSLHLKEVTPTKGEAKDSKSRRVIGYDLVNGKNGELIDTSFTFVDTVDRAPMFMRRKAIQAIGSLDDAFAPVACDDADICLRAWKSGWQVGLYSSRFVRNVGVGGMRLFNVDLLPAQARKNWQLIFDRYGDDIAAGNFTQMVAEARRANGLDVNES